MKSGNKIKNYVTLLDKFNNSDDIRQISINEKELSKFAKISLNINYKDFLASLNKKKSDEWIIVYNLIDGGGIIEKVLEYRDLILFLDTLYDSIKNIGGSYCYLQVMGESNYFIQIHYQNNIELIISL